MCDAYECEQNDRSTLNGSIESLSLSQSSSKSDRRKTQFDDSKCKKCASPNPAVKVHTQGSHCRDCFLTYANHKFRSTIGKEGIIPYGAKVVLGYSGGPASTAMIKLLGDSLREKKKKANLNFQVYCIHVDFSIPINSDTKFEDLSVTSQMESFCHSNGFEFQIIKASEWFEQNTKECLENFLNIKDATLRLDRELQIVRKILTQFCSANKYGWLMLGQCLFRSAVNALTQVCQGRGVDLGSICKFADFRLSDESTIVYPMKEFTSKEVAFFNQFNQLESFKFTDEETATESNSSIQRLTENFLLNLQVDFPAAVPNARNSGEKVLPRKMDNGETGSVCSICLMPFDNFNCNENDLDNARTAAEFSRQLCNPTGNFDHVNSGKYCSFCCTEDPF
ncbi:cytoplasmic tRNA 2-thiolation protein 2-like [Convolutriloba macropyga]|uniref:cytoplasmic tRNA 2-thiolation protein 2-like n=1 Tax=Convolutriloba macropyga TaxID=536237 RepID=UPI003F526358